MIKKEHQIESAIVEIAFPDEEVAFAQHGLFESFVRKNMFLAINDIFDEFSDENTIYSIQKLEMDLGVISVSYSYADFESKLRAKLRESIENELAYYNQYPDKKLRKITHSESELELICAFLERGNLRWNAKISDKVSLEELFKTVIENDGLALIEFLAKSGKRKEVIRRLTTQFDSPSLSALFGLMFQIDSDELENTIDWIISLGAERFELKGQDLTQRVWLEIFQLVMFTKVNAFRIEDVLVTVLKTISSQAKLEHSLVLNKLLSHAKVVQTSPRLTHFLGKILRNYSAETERKELLNISLDNSEAWDDLSSDNNQAQAMERSRILALRARLVEAINTGFAGKILPYWSELFRKYSITTEEVLYTLGQKREARKNIAWKFPEPVIVQIVKLLEPTHYSFIEKMVSEPKLFFQAEQDLELEESNAKKSLWEFTLTYLIVDRGSRFNRKSYIASVMRQMAAHINVDLTGLYESLITLLDPVSKTNLISNEFMELLVELKSEIGVKTKPLFVSEKRTGIQESHYVSKDRKNKASFKEKDGIEPDKLIIEAFYQGVRQSKLNLVEPIWTDILKFHGEWFLETLRRLGQHQEIRRNISRMFKDPMLFEIVKTLEPENSEFICDSVKAITSSQNLRSDSDTKRTGITYKQNIQISRATIWEFTLGHLLVERGSRFNKKSYLASVIKQLSARENISARAMYDTIMSSFLMHHKTNASYHYIIDLLKDVGSDFQEDIQEVVNLGIKNSMGKNPALDLKRKQGNKSIPFVEQKSKGKDNQQMELIRAYMLYEKLCEELSNAEARGISVSYHIIRLFHELLENYPWKLHRFNQELSAGRWSAVHFLPKLPLPLQRKLLLSYFDSFRSKFDFGINLFIENISRFEKSMLGNENNYLIIFHRIVNDEIFDLELIFAEDVGIGGKLEEDISNIERSSVSQKYQSNTFDSKISNNRKIANDSLPLNHRTYDLVRAYLHGNLELDSRNSSLLANVLERVLNTQPDTLKTLLGESLFDKDCAFRLVLLLPESLLAKVLLLMRSKEHAKSILYADLIVVAYIGIQKKSRINVSHLHSLKWLFILNYLLVEGRNFNEVTFTKLFIGFLINEMKVANQKEFPLELAKGISITTMPSTHVASARVAMILSSLMPTNSGSSTLDSREKKYPDSIISEFSNRQIELKNEVKSSAPHLDSIDHIFEDEENDIQEDIYIENSGLVLLSPYLPRYFESLGFLENQTFKDRDAAERGVHLLQYMVDGNTNNPEYLLVLNKVLCGIKTGIPIARGIEISEEEKELSESLLLGIIDNWPALQNTSIEGLRESFLQRKAHLQLKENAWQLLVESKAFDMLLDEIPWNYKILKLPWMESLINVDWR